ncbi:tyrosine recombinase XerD [Oxobacter pfennigii]|uniref:Tyrosine recombinase XerD n=1 Tax=Oxobacter pfennigii TaxID=36849 RepID=A0A0P8Y6W9_9CLOT|nr:site-specific integrase [Oxobacter pfennigii]KPU42173.1 tyrosine recombinase XerD [Oxobacter pfennigii]
MNYVEPIRDPIILENIANDLKKSNMRDYVMFMYGIYTGRRISDIIKLRVNDLKGKEYINLRETKTGKQVILPINKVLKKILDEYLKDMSPEEYVFKSSQKKNKPIDRTTAYKILKNAGNKYGLENIGTHTLRKTFGYHFYMQKKDVVMLMEILNHCDPGITLRYIGLIQESINDAVKKFKIF